MAQMAQIDRLACYLRGDKGTLMDTSHATCRPNYCTALERHDSAWTTLQPSHESPTDDDALPSPVAPFAGVSVVSHRAEHSTAANATLHPVNPRRACKARPRPTPTPTPEAFVAVIRQHHSLLLATVWPRPAFCIMLPRRRHIPS
jgi:hypothetical protein